jgi:hypothetical protein
VIEIIKGIHQQIGLEYNEEISKMIVWNIAYMVMKLGHFGK